MAFALAAFAGLTLALGAADARVAANEWAGTWSSSSLGTIVLTQSGAKVSGTYTGTLGPLNGRISGTLTYQYAKYGAFRGTWTDAGRFSGPKDGTLELSMDPSLLSFSGEHSRDGLVWATRKSALPSTTAAPTTKTAPRDTSPPVVQAVVPAGIQKPATRIELRISLKDDSGRAAPQGTLYDGGTVVRTAGGTNKPATGQTYVWDTPLRADLKGPLAFCVWAEDAAGNKSARAPRSSCKWISLLVDIDLVSNTCGGEGWEIVVGAQNYFGNTSDYVEDTSGHAYTVDFRDACNLHDAGYGGHTVRDKLNGGDIDYHTWTRKRVDDKFQSDMWLLCRKQIPPSVKTALRRCIRDGRRYLIVRTLGSQFFDYDLMTPGTQSSGHRH